MRTQYSYLTIMVVAIVGMAGCAPPGSSVTADSSGNLITGDGLVNPTTSVVTNWGDLPEGREWGTTAGVDVDPHDGHIWAYERCGAGSFGDGEPVNCETNPVPPVFKFDRNTGKVLVNFGADLMVTPHGIHVDAEGNVWITDFAGNREGTRGHQVWKFSSEGEVLLTLGVAGQPGNAPGQFNQPNDVVTGPDGSIYVSDGHNGQGMTSNQAMNLGREAGQTARIQKFTPQGEFLMEWGEIGVEHGQFRTPHALAFDSQGRLWIADRGNHRLEIYDVDGNYLDSRYSYGRISGIFIKDEMVYAIDSESSPTNHPNWRNGVRIGPVDEDRIVAFVPPFERESRVYQGTAGEGVAVDEDGNIYAAEGPNSLRWAGGAFTKYVAGN